ncbi:hypothetical protein [Pseudomonas aeruginosa]|uniref:hypothetical protein n=1 Tax=Pseudomonas aeruginosa TaxID=287 RepID=UPI00211364A5|nr:hypothetical protein [Pseudomonas aeruginosa]MCT9634096.1 hypothetical protein [Pseudomonas aeruginosa]
MSNTNEVVNLTKFKTTRELEAFGVRDLTSWKEFQEIRSLLFFPVLPTRKVSQSALSVLVKLPLLKQRNLAQLPFWSVARLG